MSLDCFKKNGLETTVSILMRWLGIVQNQNHSPSAHSGLDIGPQSWQRTAISSGHSLGTLPSRKWLGTSTMIISRIKTNVLGGRARGSSGSASFSFTVSASLKRVRKLKRGTWAAGPMFITCISDVCWKLWGNQEYCDRYISYVSGLYMMYTYDNK